MSLTAKQEKFIQGIVSGLSQREAYKQAYNTNKMKNETIDNKAYILFKKDEVRARYNELLNEYKEEAKYSRLDMEADLIWIKDKAKEDINNPKKGLKQANGTVFINAIKELGELNDLYPAKKQDINVNGEINNPYAELTTEQLLKLANDKDE